MGKTVEQLLEGQRELFRSGATLDVDTRLAALRLLREGIMARESAICEALHADLGKSPSESFMSEVGIVIGEINFMLRHVRRLARRRPAHTPISQMFSRSFELAMPLGNVLVISPWNYPFMLTMEPLVDAIAAGNTVIVKPSAYSPATGAVMSELIGELFPQDYVACVLGGREENQALLDQDFDLVFFTGSEAVGKVVLERSAKHLTPTILELGGKSPCIVDSTAKLELAAKRIVWGKFLNCGQTCVAPDYVICDASIRDELVYQMQRQIRAQFGASPLENGDYGSIVNAKHFNRLSALMKTGNVVCGGTCDARANRIEPSIMVDVGWDDPIMQEEIFGPIMPIVTYSSLDEALARIADRPKPLALYLFSEEKATIDRVMTSCRFGGGCVNDTVIHIATPSMRFGGVGESGMGGYHGEAGFAAFSHYKSIVDKVTWFDLPMRYQPFNKVNDLIVKMVLR